MFTREKNSIILFWFIVEFWNETFKSWTPPQTRYNCLEEFFVIVSRTIHYRDEWFVYCFLKMFSSAQTEEPAWTGFAMEQIMKTLSFVNSSLVQAPREEKEKLAHKLDDTLYCAKVRVWGNAYYHVNRGKIFFSTFFICEKVLWVEQS